MTKKDFPNIEDSVDGEFLPIVGGAWFTNHGNNHSYNDTDGDDQFVRVIDENITSPALCVNTIDNDYKLADHPTASTLASMLPELPSGHGAFPRRTIGRIFKADGGSLYPVYNGDAETIDGSPTITIPANQETFQSFIVPQRVMFAKVMTGDDPDWLNFNHEKMLDDNGLLETGENTESKTSFWAGPERELGAFMRLDSPDIIVDHLTTGIYLEAILGPKPKIFPNYARGYFAIHFLPSFVGSAITPRSPETIPSPPDMSRVPRTWAAVGGGGTYPPWKYSPVILM